MIPRLVRLLAFSALAGAAPLFAADAVPPQKTVITCQGRAETTSTATETTFIFNTLVTVEATNLRMTCDRLEIVASRPVEKLKELGDKSLPDADKFKSLIATGRVRIDQDGRVATCGRAEIFPREDSIVLTENPLVEDEGVSWAGDKIRMLRGERQVITDGPVKIALPPVKDLGAKKEKPAEKKP